MRFLLLLLVGSTALLLTGCERLDRRSAPYVTDGLAILDRSPRDVLAQYPRFEVYRTCEAEADTLSGALKYESIVDDVLWLHELLKYECASQSVFFYDAYYTFKGGVPLTDTSSIPPQLRARFDDLLGDIDRRASEHELRITRREAEPLWSEWHVSYETDSGIEGRLSLTPVSLAHSVQCVGLPPGRSVPEGTSQQCRRGSPPYSL